jgi:hypothetical protein
VKPSSSENGSLNVTLVSWFGGRLRSLLGAMESLVFRRSTRHRSALVPGKRSEYPGLSQALRILRDDDGLGVKH